MSRFPAWNNTPDAPDRQEKKQAEFLVHQAMPWNLVRYVGVYNAAAEQAVNAALAAHPQRRRPAVGIQGDWYY